jgi:cell division protein FtsQ
MHKSPHQTIKPTETARPRRVPKKRRNRRRRDWNRTIRRVCGLIFAVELALLVFANPHLQVTRVQINGLKTLSTQQVFDEARVPARTNLFWMVLRQPFGARLAHNPVIDHVTRSLRLPHTLVLNVTERRPYAALAVADGFGNVQYWVLDHNRVPFRVFASPPAGVPLLEWQGTPPVLALGKPLADPRLTDAYALLAMVRNAPNLAVQKIKVDQYANLCLNSVNHLQIKLGQPDALPEKIALAQAALGANGGTWAQHVACLDLSCPQQPVIIPSTETSINTGSDIRQEVYGQ